jgi:hypothetical protein
VSLYNSTATTNETKQKQNNKRKNGKSKKANVNEAID